jgi:hypothetical protein
MALSRDFLEELRRLNRAEKFQVVQLLIDELATEEEIELKAGVQYEVWSPYDAADAAASLKKMLIE